MHVDPEAKTAAQLSINFADIKLEPQTDQNSQWARLCGGGAYRADATFLQDEVWINERDPGILHEMSQSSVNLFPMVARGLICAQKQARCTGCVIG